MHSRLFLRPLTGLLAGLSLGLSACFAEPEDFNQRLAEITCELSKECNPPIFMQTCQPLCGANDDCPSGRCNLITGICRDLETAEELSTESIDEPCSQDGDCSPGLLCGTIFSSEQACVDRVSEGYQGWADHCEYDQEQAQECIKQVKKRTCDQEMPEVCGSVYTDCVF